MKQQWINKLAISVLSLWSAFSVQAQNVYEISVPKVSKKIYTGHLKLGGTSSVGGSIEVNSFYMSQNGQPILPVMGRISLLSLSCRPMGGSYLKNEGRWIDHNSYLCFLECTRGERGSV